MVVDVLSVGMPYLKDDGVEMEILKLITNDKDQS
jgi:hypothetical protein